MRKAQNTETWHRDITALILHRISLFKFDEIEGKIKDTHERHLVTSPQQFHECIFLYFFLPFLFLNISRDFKWVKVSFTLSRTRGAAKHATEVTSLKSQTQKPDSAVALNINYTAQTLSFPLELAPCFSCLQTCKQCLDVLCAPLSSILQKRKKKTKPQGRKCSFNKWTTERRNLVRNASVRYGKMRSQKGSIVPSALSVQEQWRKVMQDQKAGRNM